MSWFKSRASQVVEAAPIQRTVWTESPSEMAFGRLSDMLLDELDADIRAVIEPFIWQQRMDSDAAKLQQLRNQKRLLERDPNLRD